MKKPKKRKIIGSAIVGNIVEYYDFGIYIVYTNTIGRLFFGAADPFLQTLLALSVFAAGFLVRPVGGMIFGHIGDIFGRKVALTISILGMALSTLMIGCLPSYESIGLFAPTLLVIIRLFQGLCIGGEGAGSAIFILEHLDGYKPGLIGSIVMASNMIGTLMANVVGLLILQVLGDTDFTWRIGFFLGAAMGAVGLYMRTNLSETPQFKKTKENKETVKFPLLQVMRKNGLRLLLVTFLGGMTAAVAYMIRGYFNTFFHEVLHYSKDQTLYFTSFTLGTMILTLPLFGLLADKVGYRKFLYKVSYLIILLIVPIFMLIANPEHNLFYVFAGIIAYGMLAAAICAPAYPYAISAFATEFRYSAVAFSWNAGIALFGGTTPAISHALTKIWGVNAPSYYIIVMMVAFVLISFLTRSDKH